MTLVDRRTQFVQNLVQRYGPQVADLFGIKSHNVDFNVVQGLTRNSEDGRLAQGLNYNIDIDRKFLRTTSRADLRGAVIHELTHALGPGTHGDNAERFANYARYELNPHEAKYWQAGDDVLAMARRRGDEPVTQNNGPRTGQGGNTRNNNTVVHNNSHGRGQNAPPPVVSPTSAVNYGARTAQLQLAYFQQLAQIKAQGGQIRSDFTNAKAAAQQTAIANMAHTEAGALDRGIVNSSIDLGARTGVLADRTTAIQQAIAARQAGRLGLQTARLNAANDYWTGAYQVQADKAAEEAQMAADALYKDQVLRSGDESAPPARTAPRDNPPPPARSASGTYDADELFNYFMRQSNGDASWSGRVTKNILGEHNFDNDSVIQRATTASGKVLT